MNFDFIRVRQFKLFIPKRICLSFFHEWLPWSGHRLIWPPAPHIWSMRQTVRYLRWIPNVGCRMGWEMVRHNLHYSMCRMGVMSGVPGNDTCLWQWTEYFLSLDAWQALNLRWRTFRKLGALRIFSLFVNGNGVSLSCLFQFVLVFVLGSCLLTCSCY